ncbi:MAG TPA: 2-dehydropantoate 2-reductase N-terminal domain-containing protein [Anaerolineales bacterium]|nr:2-dehydropantoate 2-reductase N-terminal domain-containing protein [Anaerolineales bacterium]
MGAGIIGSIYGWAFAEAGHDVTHLVRPGRSSHFHGGMQIDMYDVRKGHQRDFIGLYPIRLTETPSISGGYELVIVPTKHFRLEETLASLVPQVGDSDFLLLTQNWNGTQKIDMILSPSRYVFGDAKAGGKFEGEKLIATISSMDIGQVGGRHDACLDRVIKLCQSAQVGVTVHPEILHYLWIQYAITGGLWPALVKAGSLPAVLRDRKLGEQAIRAARECLEVVARRGVELKDYPETKMYMSSLPFAGWIAGVAIQFMFRFNKLVQRSSAHGLGDAEEVSVFYHDLVNTGGQLGVDMPAMCAFEHDIQSFVASKHILSAV